MTVGTSPDWLPPGWTLEFRFQKTGRRIMQYINRATGQKFFTKDDLIHYTKMVSKQCDDNLPTLRQITKPSATNQVNEVNTAVKENEHPEWLPKNWLMKIITRKSGITMGRQFKIYIDPSTGIRFQSKPQVLRFLNQAEQSNGNPNQKKTASHFREKVVIEKSTVDDLPSELITEVNTKQNANGVRRDPTAVNENERPEWLPEHWLMEIKTRKSGITIGKQIKIYIDPSTGSTFYSKPQVLRFLNQAEQRNGNPNQKKTASHFSKKGVIEKSTVDDLPLELITEVNTKQNANGVRRDPTTVQENERPEWLPESWLMEIKTRRSGITIGRQIKIYVDPLTGLKFFSKPQVLRFLSSAEQGKKNPKQKKKASHSRKEVVIETSTVDDLPSGWVKEVKIKRNAHGVQKLSSYTDPARGYVFPSKKAVLSYLETGTLAEGVFLPENYRDDQNLTNTDEPVVIETSTEDDLPSGWIKEVKLRRSANGFRTYLYYSDPASGLVFRSKKAVLRYLETGEIAKGLFLLEKNNDGQILTNAAKRQKVKHLANRQQLVTGGETSDRSVLSDLETENFEKNQSNKDYAETGLPTSSILQVPQAKGSVENASKRNPETDLPPGFTSQLDRLEPELVAIGLEHVNPCQNEAIEVEDVLGKQPQMLEIEKTSDTKSELFPLTSSDPCLEFTTKTLRDGVPREDAVDEGLVSTPPSSVLQETNLGETKKERKRSNTGTTKSSKSKKIKEPDLPHLFSKQLARLGTELVANGVSTKVAIQSTTRKSGEHEAKPPCVLVDKATQQLNIGPNATLPNQASAAAANPDINNISSGEDKTILGERPLISGTQKGNDNNLELQPLFCSDPCLEFAIKTLTGAIPLEDAINKGLVSTPVANIQQQNNLAETRTEHSRCRKTLFNTTSSKEDGGLHQQSSKGVAGHAPELEANSFSNELVLNIAARKLDLISAELREISSQQPGIEQRMAYGTTLSHVESSNKSKEPRNNQTVPTQMNNDNPSQRSPIPSWSSWSDPCFKSPFKTVADSSPAERSFAFQRNFGQQFGRDGNFALPDHSFFNIFQRNHVDRTGQPVLQQQFGSNPLFLQSSNVSLPRSSTIGAQQSTRKGKKRNNKTV